MDDTYYRELLQKKLSEKDFFEAWRFSTRIWEKVADDWYQMAVCSKELGNIPMYLYYLSKSAERAPEKYYSEFQEMIYEFKRKEKMVFLCHPKLDTFIRDIYDVLKNLFDTKIVVSSDPNEINQAYEWADIVWLEWGNELTIYVTNNLNKENKKILCRTHSYEVFKDFPKQIDWSKIDKCVFVGTNILNQLVFLYPEVFDEIQNKIHIVPNGLNLNKFRFSIREKGFKIAVVASIIYTKNPYMWFYIIKSLLKKDPRYELHIAGTYSTGYPFANREIDFFKRNFEQTFEIKSKIYSYGYTNDINNFLEDKNFLLSASAREVHPYNIREAMAKGIKPVIGFYPGVYEQFPKELIYSDFCELIEIFESDYNSEKYRMFVEDNYSLDKKILQFYEIIVQML